MKRIGVICPTNAELIEKTAGLAAGTLEAASRRLGKFLAENSFGISGVPARGVGLWSMESYLEAGGADALAFAPHAKEQSEEYIARIRKNASSAHRVVDDVTWGEEPFELAKACDCLAVIGASCGTFVEMIATKWMQGPPVYAVSSLLTAIPAEILAEIDVAFFEGLDELEDAMGRLNQ